jgi:hypothetical protein
MTFDELIRRLHPAPATADFGSNTCKSRAAFSNTA